MIEAVDLATVADALKGKSGGRRNKLGQVCVGRTKPAICLARKEANAFAANSGMVIKERPSKRTEVAPSIRG